MSVSFHWQGLEGKVAVVTGASQNLGAAMARALAAQGCKVAVVGRRNRAGAEAAVAQIREAGGTALAWCADLTVEEEVTALFRSIVEALGPVEILVNNAGGSRQPLAMRDMSLAEWRKMLTDNLDSAFLCSRAVIPGMADRQWGRIINLASMTARVGRPNGDVAYSAAKGGIVSLTRQMAMELGPDGITVNAIAPGTTVKEVGWRRSQEFYDALAERIPLRRLGLPMDQAAAVCFLASPSAGWITGVTVDVDGGQTMTTDIPTAPSAP